MADKMALKLVVWMDWKKVDSMESELGVRMAVWWDFYSVEK